MFKSLIMAFSTYSKIPMPRIKWDEKNMSYSMCFFPFVGVVIGGVNFGLIYLLKELLGISPLLIGVIITVIPILITGGIHFDGFLDVADARSSYKDREEKLRILKDPHVGAFAIIYGICYMMLAVGCNYQLVADMGEPMMVYVIVGIGFAFSRVLSGLSVLTLKKAKKDGMVAAYSQGADKRAKAILALELVVILVALVLVDLKYGVAVIVAGIISFIYYVVMSYKTFGGITGDLAGWFLQVCELNMLIFVVVVQRITVGGLL